MRTLQEWLGHRDIKTTRLYADYQASDQERELIERAFRGPIPGPNRSETEMTSADLTPTDGGESDLELTPSVWLWSRRSPVRVRSLTLTKPFNQAESGFRPVGGVFWRYSPRY